MQLVSMIYYVIVNDHNWTIYSLSVFLPYSWVAATAHLWHHSIMCQQIGASQSCSTSRGVIFMSMLKA